MTSLFLPVVFLVLSTVVLAVPPPPRQKREVSFYSDFINPEELGDEDDDDAFQSARTQFKYMYLKPDGTCQDSYSSRSLEVAATMGISDSEMLTGCETVGKAIQYASYDTFTGLQRSASIGLFTWDDKLSIFPEYNILRDTPACAGRCDNECAKSCTSTDGRKWDTIAGIGGGRAACVVNNFMCYDNDPYYFKYSVLVHEFAHSMHASLSQDLKDRIQSAYDNAKLYSTWDLSSYAMSNEWEYFATASASFFNVDELGEMGKCGKRKCSSETEARYWIRGKDSQLHGILEDVWTSGDDSRSSGLSICP